MLYGLPGTGNSVVAPCLYPTPLGRYDNTPATPKTTQSVDTERCEPRQGDPGSAKGQGKGKKGRKRKPRGKKDKEEEEDPTENGGDGAGSNIQRGMERLTLSQEVVSAATNTPYRYDPLAPVLPWTQISSSESDYSDTEGGQSAKLRGLQSKIRQSSLAGFHSLIKVTIMVTMYGACHESNHGNTVTLE